jgi:hypothetical protein
MSQPWNAALASGVHFYPNDLYQPPPDESGNVELTK